MTFTISDTPEVFFSFPIGIYMIHERYWSYSFSEKFYGALGISSDGFLFNDVETYDDYKSIRNFQLIQTSDGFQLTRLYQTKDTRTDQLISQYEERYLLANPAR